MARSSMTDDQIHQLSASIKKLEAAEQDVKKAEDNLAAAKKHRDKLSTAVQRLRDGAPLPPVEAQPKAA